MWINQTIFPHYREKLIHLLRERLGDRLLLTGGLTGFYDALETTREMQRSVVVITNRFGFHRELLWQAGVLRYWNRPGVLVTEFNLRTVSTWILIFRRRRARLPVVFWGHIRGRSNGWFPRKVRRYMLKYADGFICYTETDRKRLSSEFPKLPIWVAPNSISSAADLGGEAPCLNPLDIIYVSRLVSEKKPELLVKAFILCKKRGWVPKATKCVFVGEGPLLGSLQEMVTAEDFGLDVEFKGEISGEAQLRRLYSHSLCAISSGYVGLSAIQAFSFGAPMIVADNEPHSPEIEACQEGANCLFFKAGDPESLASSIRNIFAESQSWILRRPAIAKRIRNSYTIDKIADTFLACDRFFEAQAVRKVEAKRIRVLVYWDYFQNYHCARIREILRRQAEFGIEVFPVSLAASGTDAHESELAEDLRDKVHVLRPIRVQRPAHDYETARALIAYVGLIKPDVIVTPGYVGVATLRMLLWARINRRAAVLMFDSQYEDMRRIWWREKLKGYIVRSYDAAFASGTSSTAYLESLGFSGSNVETGYDVIDNEMFATAAQRVREKKKWPSGRLTGKKYFLSVGRFVKKKNFDGLILAYKKHIGSRRDYWPLVIIGDGPERPALLELVKKLKLDESVIFTGYLSSQKIIDYIAFCGLFIVPSKEEEQWGLVINEAMAAGAPVLASSVCGATKDLIVHKYNGLEFDPNGSMALSASMDYALGNEVCLSELGSRGRVSVGRFSIERHAEAFFKCVHSALVSSKRRLW